jgi:diguanylate cyclase (GGDEF)-like protein
LLRDGSREHEVVGRYGGEEFLILMPNTAKDVALRMAERIRALVEGTPFEHAEAQPTGHVTISGGVATAPGDGDDVDSLLRNADAALYQAKRAGRNRVVAFAGDALVLAGVDAAAAVDADAETELAKEDAKDEG